MKSKFFLGLLVVLTMVSTLGNAGDSFSAMGVCVRGMFTVFSQADKDGTEIIGPDYHSFCWRCPPDYMRVGDYEHNPIFTFEVPIDLDEVYEVSLNLNLESAHEPRLGFGAVGHLEPLSVAVLYVQPIKVDQATWPKKSSGQAMSYQKVDLTIKLVPDEYYFRGSSSELLTYLWDNYQQGDLVSFKVIGYDLLNHSINLGQSITFGHDLISGKHAHMSFFY